MNWHLVSRPELERRSHFGIKLLVVVMQKDDAPSVPMVKTNSEEPLWNVPHREEDLKCHMKALSL